MKHKLKSLAALLLSVIMVLSMSVSAFAEDNTNAQFRLTIKTKAGHTYKVYQLATGTLYTDSDGKLGLADIKVGKNALSTTTVNDITALSSKSGGELSTAAYALVNTTGKVESGKTEDNYTPVATLEGDGSDLSTYGLAAGYYVVTDSWTKDAISGETLSRAMVELVQDVTITPKQTTVPSVKKIDEGNEPTKKDDGDKDYNTANIGDNVPYVVESEIPDMTGYSKFYFVLRDTLSAGLTYNKDMEVYVDGVKVNASKYTVTAGKSETATGGTYIEVVMEDFKTNWSGSVGKKIDFVYSATVNSDAVIGNGGNPNTENIVYSSNPNLIPDGDKDNGNKPKGLTENSTVEGTTPTTNSEVKTYVAGIKITKVEAGTDAPLANVAFEITGEGTETTYYEEKKEAFEVDNTKGTWYLLKDGTYTETAPTTDDVTTWTCYDVNGTKLENPHTENHNSSCTYVTVKGNSDQYQSTTVKYSKHNVVETTTKNKAVTVHAAGKTDKDGVLSFTGLAAGTYTITELKTNDGYNLLKNPISVVITLEDASYPTTAVKLQYKEAQELNADSTYKYGDVKDVDADGIVKIKVENSKGTILPSTGGIGTTIFYVVGSILVIGAAVLLIAGKRKESAK